ncbi:MAG TPA: lactonase family protein [Bryobacteraceae bacterium]|nr:lactonase family protein [Bryobacteraceae bacterium]
MLTRRQFGIVTAGAVGQLLAADKENLVYVGTYTRGGSKGIYSYRFNPASGKLTEIGLAAEMPSPSFLYVTPNGRRLYAVGEQRGGLVSGFNIDRASGKLTAINQQQSGGDGPCHLAADPSGKVLVAAHYGSGSTAAFPIKADGSLGESSALIQHKGSSAHPQRQNGPHAHSVNFSKNGKYVVIGDLGLDQYIVYAVDTAKGTLTEHSVTKVNPGSGPRHLAFHPNYKFAYGDYELTGEAAAFQWDDAAGKLTHMQTLSTLPADYTGPKSCAEILVHPTGKFVYVSNRGHDSIAMYSTAADGKLTFLGTTPTEGKTPRNFRIDPSGAWLIAANQDGGNMVVFKVDKATGKLTSTGEQAKLPFPVSIKFVV